jgi:hypothetical protein
MMAMLRISIGLRLVLRKKYAKHIAVARSENKADFIVSHSLDDKRRANPALPYI